MIGIPHRRMKKLLEFQETDPEYLWLRSRRDAMEEYVTRLCSGFTSEERGILLEYWGISQEMMLRSVEIACFIDEEWKG